jgi:hypothetical protein
MPRLSSDREVPARSSLPRSAARRSADPDVDHEVGELLGRMDEFLGAWMQHAHDQMFSSAAEAAGASGSSDPALEGQGLPTL